MECFICVEKYNKSQRSQILCDFCDFESCKECWKKYLLDTTEDIHCMRCKKSWDRNITIKKLGKTFLDKQYKKRREELLFERERGMFPATQPYVEKEIETEKINSQIYELDFEIHSLLRKKHDLKMKIHKISDINKKQVFIRPCSKENCKGFLSTQWKCGICENYTCNQCLEFVGSHKEKDEHKCDPNNMETAKLLLNDTKPCPKCGSGIFKIEGCDQMFCTQCHTPFSWTTGKVEKGRIHNPHFFEWMRKEGRVMERPDGEILCGRDIDHWFIVKLENMFRGNKHDIVVLTLKRYRNLIHLREVDLGKYRTDRLGDNLQMRVDFMRNKMSEDEFKVTLQKREKERMKKTEIFNILNMFINCNIDIAYRFVEFIETNGITPFLNGNGIIDFRQEWDKILSYTNDSFIEVSKNFGCKVFVITPNWSFI